MPSPFDSALDTSATEGIPLAPLLIKVCSTHFNTHSKRDIRWGIPVATTVTRLISHTAQRMNIQEQAAFDASLALIHEEKYLAASNLLRPLADIGHIDAEQLLILTLKRLQADWESYAQRRASRTQTLQVVPASSYEREQDCIVIHQYLAYRRAPRYVLAYLIYHECARLHHEAFDSSAFTPEFLGAEASAPYRNKANLWLKRHGFPIFRLESAL